MTQSSEGAKESRTRVSERGFLLYMVALRPSCVRVCECALDTRFYLRKVILRDNLN